MAAAAHLDPFRLADAPAPDGAEDVRAVMTEITPDMAAQWMKDHQQAVAAKRAAGGGTARDNRPVRWGDVAKYARDMTAGNWRRNGETVKRATDGTVPDGQHRLYACMQAEVPFWSLVVTGVAPDAQDTIDTGIRRKLSDQLAIGNEKNAVILASVARWSLRWLHGVRGGTSRGGGFDPTYSEVLDFIELTPQLRDATQFAVHAREVFKPVRASVYGVAWMLFNGINDIAAKVFLDGVTAGADLPAGHSALAFRTRMLNAALSDERLNESEQLALMIFAWNAFREDRKMAVVQLPKGGLTAQNFPEPK